MIDFNFDFGFDNFFTEPKKIRFNLAKSIDIVLDNIALPKQGECCKSVSPRGGWSSCSYICAINQLEKISSIIITTLRVGEKELDMLENEGIKNVTFILSKVQKLNNAKYQYFDDFEEKCKKNKWKYKEYNNHSKIALIKTKKNYYVLETSSNLNENPMVEQFSLTNDKELYDWYIWCFKEMKVI